jgi:hypothetical protein
MRRPARHLVRDCGRNATALSRMQYFSENSANEMRTVHVRVHAAFMSLNAD